MDKEKVKQILSAVRASGKDQHDPEVRHALNLAEQDGDLSSFALRVQEIDRHVAKVVQSEQPPADLRDRLLQIPASTDVPERRRPAASQIIKFAIAACLIAAAVALWQSTRPAPVTTTTFAQFAISRTIEGLQPAKLTDDLDAQQEWLAASHSPHNFAIPERLLKLSAKGCHSYTVAGRRMSVICFELENGRLVHLFAVAQDSSVDDRATTHFVTVNYQSQQALTWSDGQHTLYLVSKDMTAAELERFI